MYTYIDTYTYIYIYIHTHMYIYIYIQTRHAVRLPVPLRLFDSFFLTARGALTVSRGGSYALG